MSILQWYNRDKKGNVIRMNMVVVSFNYDSRTMMTSLVTLKIIYSYNFLLPLFLLPFLELLAKKGKSLFKEQVLGAWELWLFWENMCVSPKPQKSVKLGGRRKELLISALKERSKILLYLKWVETLPVYKCFDELWETEKLAGYLEF